MEKINPTEIKIKKLSPLDLKRVKEFQNYINSLVEERAMIIINKKKDLKEEKKWLESKLKNLKNKKEILLIAQNKKEIVGITHIQLKEGRQNHVGEFGISVKKEYRGIGLGKKLMAQILKLAKKELKPKPKIIRLSVFSKNKIAQNLYQKFGFKKVAEIPQQFKYKGKLINEVIMIKKI